MKVRLTLLLLFIAPVLIKAQQITGKVLRFNSDTVVSGASVYFSGSIKGTSTNDLGEFTLNADKSKVPLVVSCIGYYSTVVTDYGPDKPITVYLNPKVNTMREIVIGFDGLHRAEKVRIFKREFIGISDYALSCTITNIDDIEFNYDKSTETLTAFCNKPIVVKNKMLGYTINYYLDKFIRSNGHVRFAGNYQFKEDVITDAKELKRVKQNREAVYSGSRMQFIRLLWHNNLVKHKFEMYDNHYAGLTADSLLYTNVKGEKFININRTVRIAYNRDYLHVTYLTQNEALSFIDKDGFYGIGLSWSGKMSAQRIGDLLPFEYESPQDGK